MNKICLHMGCMGNLFVLPSKIVDHYLALASPEDLKLILFLFRHAGEEYSIEELARLLKCSENAITTSLSFWERCDVFPDFSNRSYSETNPISGIPVAEPKASVADEEKQNKKNPVARKSNLNSKGFLPAPTQMANTIDGNEDLKNLMSLAEQAKGAPLIQAETRSLCWMMEYLGFSAEIICTIIHSVPSFNCANLDRLAADLYEANIQNYEEAETFLQKRADLQQEKTQIKKIMQMDVLPTDKQIALFQKWKSMGFSTEMIEIARNRAIENTNRAGFEYIDRILYNWSEKQIFTPEMAEHEQKSYEERNKRGNQPVKKDVEKNNNHENRSYDDSIYAGINQF